MKKKRKNFIFYTMVELMVAVAVLALMMTFLLRFINGAQRIWSASGQKTEIALLANNVFDLIETDLKNALVSDEPGRELPFYLRTGTGNDDLEIMGFFSVTRSHDTDTNVKYAETYPVVYKSEGNKLFRIVLGDGAIPSISTKHPFYLYGAPPATGDYFNTIFTDTTASYYIAPTVYNADPILENVDSITVKLLTTDQTNLFTTANYYSFLPKAIQITITIEDTLDRNTQTQLHSFSRIFFLQ